MDTMDLFMLPRDIKCRVLSLLLGAVKIERDQHIVSDININPYNYYVINLWLKVTTDVLPTCVKP